MQPARPDPLKLLPVLTGALLAGSLVLLGVGYAVQRFRQPASGLEVLAWVACGIALGSPFVAGFVRSALPGPPPGRPVDEAAGHASLRRELVYFAVLESAVTLCAVALIVTPSEWPLFAALVPLGAMILGRSHAS